jgi:hypothetical protein
MKKDIYVPTGTTIFLPDGTKFRSLSIIVTEAFPYKGGFVFPYRDSVAHVKSLFVEELAEVDFDPLKASWWQWIIKDIESAGTMMGDGLRSLVMAYNKLSKAAQPGRPNVNQSKRAYSKIKLAMNLLDKAMDFALDGVTILNKTYSPKFPRN